MAKISVLLRKDRNYTGALRVQDDLGRALAGPFVVCARANDLAASEHGNSGRLQSLRYGDTPTGAYRLAGIVSTGRDTPFGVSQFGTSGMIVLEPISGVAAEAHANGRSFIGIHGGAPGAQGRLRSTNGCLRMRDEDVALVISAIAGSSHVDCEFTETGWEGTSILVTIDPDYDEGDPILFRSGEHDSEADPQRTRVSSGHTRLAFSAPRAPVVITTAARARVYESGQGLGAWQTARHAITTRLRRLAKRGGGAPGTRETFGPERNEVDEWSPRG